jgi:hypothetical protein
VLRVHLPRVARRSRRSRDRKGRPDREIRRGGSTSSRENWIGIQDLLDVESTGRNGRDGVAPLEQVLPVGVWCICVARETARRADDREGGPSRRGSACARRFSISSSLSSARRSRCLEAAGALDS